ncbi:MAG TPA: choice-of-anchor J domain-containing protein [Saprospiraceae bacterium]|nr:choice-of-anchor J domain-containing protein [Saprospiraceae bacterium]
MKRIFTLLTLCFLMYQAQSQTLFSQDFESGSLDPMIAIDVDGKVVAPQIAGLAGPTWQVVGDDKNKLVVSTSWFAPTGIADDWLISDTIHVTQPNTFLIWEAFSPDANYRDGYEVRISTTDREVASFTDVVLTVPQEMTTAQTRSLKLDAYIGKDIYFAFRNNSNDKFLLYMDNIRVEILKDNDAIVKEVNFEKYQPVNSVVPVTITIENHGALPLTSIIFEYTVGTETFTDSLTGLNIAPLKTTQITHNINYTITEAGALPVDISVSFPNGAEDGNPYDNFGSKFIYGLEEQLPKKVVVEEATGTWCTWCPRGAVFMERVATEFADIALPIAVHNGDPMTVPEYDGPFSASVSGYPSGHVDRKVVDTDPNTFLTAIQSVENRRVPVAVNVESTYDADTRIATFRAVGHLSIATTVNDLRFSAVITEDSVTGTDPGYDQINAYAGGANGIMGGFEKLPNPVPASQMVYDFVARALIGGFEGIEGSIPDVVAAGEEFEMEFSYEVPADYDPSYMKAIVFVLDEETGEILNGDTDALLGSLSVPLVPAGKFVLYPNPTSDNLNLSVDYQTTDKVSMNIYDTYGRLITSLGNLDLSSGSKVETIDVSNFPTGNYILELRHKNAVTALPFTKI